MNIRFEVKLDTLKSSSKGEWDLFGGIHKYKDADEAKKIIKEESEKIKKSL